MHSAQGKIHSKRVENKSKHTQNEWRTSQNTLKTSGEQVKTHSKRAENKIYLQKDHHYLCLTDSLQEHLVQVEYLKTILPTRFECGFTSSTLVSSVALPAVCSSGVANPISSTTEFEKPTTCSMTKISHSFGV